MILQVLLSAISPSAVLAAAFLYGEDNLFCEIKQQFKVKWVKMIGDILYCD